MKISIALTLLVAATTTSALPLFVHGPNDILPTTNPESASLNTKRSTGPPSLPVLGGTPTISERRCDILIAGGPQPSCATGGKAIP